MTTPTVYETLIHLHGGSEVEVRYWIDVGIHIGAVKIGSGWVHPETVLLPHVIDDAMAEIAEIEREVA